MISAEFRQRPGQGAQHRRAVNTPDPEVHQVTAGNHHPDKGAPASFPSRMRYQPAVGICMGEA
jgi:hypothetical protein